MFVVQNTLLVEKYFPEFLPITSSKCICIGGSRGGRAWRPPPFAWHPSSLADLGGHAWRAPPHLPGILVFDDILGHIV